MTEPPLIYNLFPRLVGPISRWGEHVERAAGASFNWIYLNPWHYPGFSGSLYAPKEIWRLNPLFLPTGTDEHSLEPLRDFVACTRELGLGVAMDLIVNHTSKDSPLIEEHPTWFVRERKGKVVSPSVTDPDDPSKVTVWGDLAEVDNAGSPDREGLWHYWADVVRRSVDLGFNGFRCDAAYMVPAALWRSLIEEARKIDEGVTFFAETLGAPVSEVLALRDAGFDFFFNSSKWWNFKDDWALEQHEAFGRIAPSISFPESHDTERLAGETDGDEAVQRQRYAFAAGFSAGVMLTLGYEFGFRTRVNVVETMPSDWEDPGFDLRPFVGRVNRLKLRHPLLHGEGRLRPLGERARSILVLERKVEGIDSPAYLMVNTDARAAAETGLDEVEEERRGLVLHRVCRDDSPEEGEPVPARLSLARAEVVYLLPA